jgi:hypothetical protein
MLLPPGCLLPQYCACDQQVLDLVRSAINVDEGTIAKGESKCA